MQLDELLKSGSTFSFQDAVFAKRKPHPRMRVGNPGYTYRNHFAAPLAVHKGACTIRDPCRAGHLRYFFFSLMRTDFFAFFIKLI